MPDPSAADAATPAAATAAAPDETTPEADSSAEGAETADDEPVFMNRAARRAHAKGAKPPQTTGVSTPQFGRKGTVQGPRQWGNRRSG